MNPTRSDSIRPSERRARRSSVHRPRLDVLAVVRSRASPSSRLRRARSNDESINQSSHGFVSFRFVSFRFVSIDILMRHFDRPVDRPRARSKGPGVTHHPRVIAPTTRRHAGARETSTRPMSWTARASVARSRSCSCSCSCSSSASSSSRGGSRRRETRAETRRGRTHRERNGYDWTTSGADERARRESGRGMGTMGEEEEEERWRYAEEADAYE